LLTDINGNRNVAGRGINQAQRIMAIADGSQVLLGDSIFELLCERESYDKHFRTLPGMDKHGNRFTVHQLVLPTEPWLNTELPSQFQRPDQQEKHLSPYVAHYICNAVVMRDFLLSHNQEHRFDYCAPAFLHILTLDSLENSSKSPLEKTYYRVERFPDGSPAPTWKAIEDSMFSVTAELSSFIIKLLEDYSSCFESREYNVFFAFPSEKGIKRVQAEHPHVWSSVVNLRDAQSNSGAN